jgi:exopolysaccharide biosynthesis polyprenyl glycosylphosphotransferase
VAKLNLVAISAEREGSILSDGKVESSESESTLTTRQPFTDQQFLKNLSRKKQKRSTLIVFLALTDIFAIILSFTLASLLRLGEIELTQLTNVLLTVIPIYIAIALNNKAYQTNVLTGYWKSINRGVIALLLASSAMLLILFFFKTSNEFSRIMFGFGTLGAAVMIIMTRSLIFKLGQKYIGRSPYADVCIYDGIPIRQDNSDAAIVAEEHGLVADPSNPDAVNRLGQLASGMDHVIVHCPPEKREFWVFMLRSLDVKSEIVVPELDSIGPLAIKLRSNQTSLLISSGQLRWDQKIVKRAFDILLMVCILPFLFPVLLIVALIIKLDSPGPVLFFQQRIGLGNRPFKIWKFRSMRTELADATGHDSTQRNDPRITKIGKIIRSTSIDELPQLFNVLRGTMSVVGPRPHAPGSRAEDMLFWDIDQRYWHRHAVKPGLTGLAQIKGFRGATEQESDLSNRLNADLEYVAEWSLWTDVKIILKTFAVLFHKNAY